MKKRILSGLLLMSAAVALTLSISTLSALAAGPINSSPASAAVLDNQGHTIQANSTLWYRFDYAGDRSPVTVTLVNGANGQVAFSVFTPQQMSSWWNIPPIGRGTVLRLNCNSSQPAPEGQCASNDLSWTGQFNAAGTYYVEVMNNASNAATPQLLIKGSGVTLAQQTTSNSTASANATATPNFRGGAGAPAPATSGANAPQGNVGANLDPGHAAVLDNTAHAIPANSSQWYRFDYAGDRSAVTITLVNGANGQVAFSVLTPQEINSWWDVRPIGRGTVYTINCNTGRPAPEGQCTSNDLSWGGEFPTAGTYYVQVTNYGPTAASPQLLIQGSGVTLGK